ncbi:hypothetical protein BOTBODRAFT_91579, partial [Botryobasidium botryosum FD-172 SS1]
PSQSALSVWGGTDTILRNAPSPRPGTVGRHTRIATARGESSTPRALHYVSNGIAPRDVRQLPATTCTNAQAVANPTTESNRALSLRRSKPLTPYNPEAWQRLLREAGLLSKYPNLVHSLRHGFFAGIPRIYRTYTPPNNASITATVESRNVFADVINKEFAKGRYLGPFSKAEVEHEIGYFQTSLLSLVPKPGKPGKFRLVQNLSAPHASSSHTPSINSFIDSDRFPATWGTFAVVALTIARLPPGSQGAVRDVAEAYRTIPVRPDQWPGLVVRVGDDDRFAIDTSACFGLASSAGLYGHVADAGADLFRAHGLGPVSKWVDDHIFFRIRWEHLDGYNALRRSWAAQISASGGQRQGGGRLWYRGSLMPDDRAEEFDEDASFPILDHSATHPRPPEDWDFTYNLVDIDRISEQLGIPWEPSKDIPFSSEPPFIGFAWNIESQTVSIPPGKCQKYRDAIIKWEAKSTHNLEEVRQLYGRLLHASLVLPAGRAYLTGLEAMLGTFNDRPFMPRHPPRHVAGDLAWWKSALNAPNPSRPIPGPRSVDDPRAFSDASSGTGLGIVIGDRWRAWLLIPGWKRDGRDIGWAEALAFELLVLTIIELRPRHACFKVFGDNRGVVEGWWKGRSKNQPTNLVFRRLHDTLGSRGLSCITRYVASGDNPADGPSRGVYPPRHLMLPIISIPQEAREFIVDVNEPSP